MTCHTKLHISIDQQCTIVTTMADAGKHEGTINNLIWRLGHAESDLESIILRIRQMAPSDTVSDEKISENIVDIKDEIGNLEKSILDFGGIFYA